MGSPVTRALVALIGTLPIVYIIARVLAWVVYRHESRGIPRSTKALRSKP